MRKAALALIFLSACSGKGEFIPTPTPAPETTNGTVAPEVAQTSTSAAPAIVTPADEESEAPAAPPTTVHDWGPVLCPGLPHPAHHDVCPVASSAGAKSRPPSEANLTKPVASSGSSSSALASIRACEQNDNPNAGPTGYASDTGNGYYGAYQFAPSTWASVGGSGNPANASPAEQDMRAQMMIDQGRRGEWPNC